MLKLSLIKNITSKMVKKVEFQTAKVSQNIIKAILTKFFIEHLRIVPYTVHCTMYNNLLHICKLCSVSIGRMSYLSLYISIYLLRRLSLYPNSCPCLGRALTRPDCWPRGAAAARSRGRAGAVAACRRWGSRGRGRGCTPASRIGRPVGPAAEAAPG
jgi:hypothetical protein